MVQQLSTHLISQRRGLPVAFGFRCICSSNLVFVMIHLQVFTRQTSEMIDLVKTSQTSTWLSLNKQFWNLKVPYFAPFSLLIFSNKSVSPSCQWSSCLFFFFFGKSILPRFVFLKRSRSLVAWALCPTFHVLNVSGSIFFFFFQLNCIPTVIAVGTRAAGNTKH